MISKSKEYRFLLIVIFVSIFSFSATSQSLNQKDQINDYLANQGFLTSDISELKISDQYFSATLNMEHIYYQQYYQDIPVKNALLNAGFRNEKLIHSNNTFKKNISIDLAILNSTISAQAGLSEAIRHLGKENNVLPQVLNTVINSRGKTSSVTFAKGDISQKEILVTLIWLKSGKQLRLCWQNYIEVPETSNEKYQILIDALTGEYVSKYNLVVECNFDETDCSHKSGSFHEGATSMTSAISLANSYNVFDLPVESPNHGPRSLTISPWNRTGIGNDASTLGWHQDGSSNYTITRGNNVYAYEDQDFDNVPGYSPDGGAPIDFNFPLNLNLPPASNMDASITNLFHTCNLIHDVMYQYGFDEQAGNFQATNLGRGGFGGDVVHAEALDGGGSNNANFYTPADGTSGRMQMFIWNSQPPPDLNVNFPSGLNPINAEESNFSIDNKLIDVGPVTGDVVLVLDSNGGSSIACSTNPISNGSSLNGKIALIDRGDCTFVEKTNNAKSYGATAIIVVNNIPGGGTITMGGNDNSIDIPAVMISYEDGLEMKNALISQPLVNVTLSGYPAETLDGSFDNGIVIHEFGHGISNRLTGGPSNSICLNNSEQMGEGWSDYFTLMLTTDWANPMLSGADIRGVGTYAIAEPTTGTGIRNFPYSTDININPVTYDDIKTFSIPHGVGSVWASMLWDMTWNIIDIEGISTDMYHGQGGNNIAMQLVMDGLKLQPCGPGFIDGRDAILLADEINHGGKYKCVIWEAFARRGLGYGASQGGAGSASDGTESFDIPGLILNSLQSQTQVIEGETVNIVGQVNCLCDTINNYQLKFQIPPGLSLISVIEGSQSQNSVVSNVTNLLPDSSVRVEFNARVDLCSVTDTVIVFEDDIEGPFSFLLSNLAGSGNWDTTMLHYKSPTTSWYAEDLGVQSDVVLELNSSIFISGPTYLSFYHRFETEENFDGGIVEISIDNGATWKNLTDDFIENGYPTRISTVGTDSRIIGQHAFTGFSDNHFGTSEFVKSVIDLCNYGGSEVRLRFRFVCDAAAAGTGINGWYIDDIKITNTSGVISKLYSIDNGMPFDSLSACINTNALNQSIIYVDGSATGKNNGGNWLNSFFTLEDALTLKGCSDADTIFIAKGTYYPNNQREASFTLGSNLTIMGGFPIGGGLATNRNPIMNESILSGDIGLPGQSSDNNYHVVYCGASVVNTVVDGVIIENGNANGEGADNQGAGIYNLGSIMLINVTTRNNSGSSSVFNGANGLLKINSDSKLKIN